MSATRSAESNAARRRRLASENHRVRIADCYGKHLGERDFAHGGAGLAEMATWLMSTAGAEASAIHVGIEVPHGPIVETLLERGFNLYAINPKQLDRFGDRFSPAGAKDDSRDAEVLADALRTDMRPFPKLALAEPMLVELREWSRMTDDLNAERWYVCRRDRIRFGQATALARRLVVPRFRRR
jgi:hypothetical protein